MTDKKDIEIVILLLVMLGMIFAFTTLKGSEPEDKTCSYTEFQYQYCMDIDHLCPVEMKRKCLNLYDRFYEEEYNLDTALNWSLCDGNQREITCECAKNTTTPCMTRCFVCE